MATPRAISFAPAPDGKSMIGHGGQTSTQVIIMTDPPQSYAVIPLGESDHKDSGHWDDQAEKLFSKAQAAPTYFLDEPESAPARHEHEGPAARPARPGSAMTGGRRVTFAQRAAWFTRRTASTSASQ